MTDQQMADVIFNLRRLDSTLTKAAVLMATVHLIGQLNCPPKYAAKVVGEVWEELSK